MITEVETGAVMTLVTEATSLTVPSLHPYYTYSCTVAAETTGLGPYSYPVEIQLPESGTYTPAVAIAVNLVLQWLHISCLVQQCDGQ